MRKVTTTHFNWLICRNLQSVLLNEECYLGHSILAAFYCFLLVGNGVSDIAGIIIVWESCRGLSGKEAACSREEKLFGKVGELALSGEGKREETSNREELQKLKVATGEWIGCMRRGAGPMLNCGLMERSWTRNLEKCWNGKKCESP